MCRGDVLLTFRAKSCVRGKTGTRAQTPSSPKPLSGVCERIRASQAHVRRARSTGRAAHDTCSCCSSADAQPTYPPDPRTLGLSELEPVQAHERSPRRQSYLVTHAHADGTFAAPILASATRSPSCRPTTSAATNKPAKLRTLSRVCGRTAASARTPAEPTKFPAPITPPTSAKLANLL